LSINHVAGDGASTSVLTLWNDIDMLQSCIEFDG